MEGSQGTNFLIHIINIIKVDDRKKKGIGGKIRRNACKLNSSSFSGIHRQAERLQFTVSELITPF